MTTDVAGAEAQRLLEHVHVVHVAAGHDDDEGALVHADGRERALERPHDHARVREPLGRRELLAVVDDDHAEAQTGEERRDRRADVPGAADHGERRRVHALEDGGAAVRQRRRAVQRGGGGQAAQRRRLAHRGAGEAAVLVQHAVLDGRAPSPAGTVTYQARRPASRASRSAVHTASSSASPAGTNVISTSAAPPQTIFSALRRSAPLEVGARAPRAALGERLRGGLHHGVLEQAAADGPGDRAVLAHQHLRAGGARRGALVGDQRDQGERAPGVRAASASRRGSRTSRTSASSIVQARGAPDCRSPRPQQPAIRTAARLSKRGRPPMISKRDHPFLHQPPRPPLGCARPDARLLGGRSSQARRRETPCPVPSLSAPSGATRAKARSPTCWPRRPTWSHASRAATTPATRSSGTARSSSSTSSPPASSTRPRPASSATASSSTRTSSSVRSRPCAGAASAATTCASAATPTSSCRTTCCWTAPTSSSSASTRSAPPAAASARATWTSTRASASACRTCSTRRSCGARSRRRCRRRTSCCSATTSASSTRTR